MISSPLFRQGDTFTVARYMPTECKMLNRPEIVVCVLEDMRRRGGDTDSIVDIFEVGECFSEGAAHAYYVRGDPYAWSDEMSEEGQKMLRFLKPLNLAQWYEKYEAINDVIQEHDGE